MSQTQNSMIILITFQTHLLCIYLMCVYECIISDSCDGHCDIRLVPVTGEYQGQ